MNLLGRDDVQREEIDGKAVLVIAIPRAPRGTASDLRER